MNEGSHFYSSTGEAVFEVPNASKGGMRGTTLKDARKLGLLPSVTTVQKILAKKELERWKFQQIILAAITLPKIEGEEDDAYCSRIIEDAFKQVDDAASKGSSIHKAIEDHFLGKPVDPAFRLYADLAVNWARENGVEFVRHELRLVNLVEGYAGTTDALALKDGQYGVVDFKSRKTKPEYKITPWGGEPMQIAAYAHCPIEHDGKLVTPSWGCNFYLSTTQEGRVGDAWYDKERLDAEYEAFRHVCAIYRHSTGFDPRIISR